MISPLFTTIVLVSCFIWLFMKFSTKKLNDSTNNYLERERQANSTRKQSLDTLQYISVNISDFNIPESISDDSVNELIEKLKSLSTKQIVNLTGITNTDLKLTYGVANLNFLMECDQNFTTLCRVVYDLGNILNNLGEKTAAINVLEKGVSFGTDISANYLLLASLYSEAGQNDRINQLITAVDALNSLTKKSTKDKLSKIMLKNGGVILNTADGTVSSVPTTSTGDSILPEDILDILETVPYKSDDQKQ